MPQIALHRHPARNRNPIADLERAIRLRPGPHAIEKILHVRTRRGRRLAQHSPPRPDGSPSAANNESAGPAKSSRRCPARLPSIPGWLLPKPESQVNSISSGMLHRHAHRVGHFAAVLPQINAAGHAHRLRNLQTHHLVPERNLLAHVLMHVAAGIIPEEAASSHTGRGSKSRARRARPETPSKSHFPGVISGYTGPRPLRFSMRRVAEHVRMDRGHFAHAAARQIIRRHPPPGPKNSPDGQICTVVRRRSR